MQDANTFTDGSLDPKDRSLPLRANNDPKFYVRFKWVGIGMLGFMIYCFYDANVTYPLQQEKWEAYTMVQEEVAELGYSAEEEQKQAVAEKWEAVLAEKGWDPKAEFENRKALITQNYMMGALAGLAGVWMLLTVWLSNGRWIELTEEGMNSSSGDSISLGEVTTLNKKQWMDKGIAWLNFDGPSGKGRFLIDNYKYQREETNEILRRIELAIGTDKIDGGPAEPALAAESGS